MLSENVPTWPCCRAAAARSTTKTTVNLVDYVGVRTAIDDISSKLFKQDGTVELLACRWSEKGTCIGQIFIALG
jgi:hypothetical protein